jgi:hypothetical protein
MAFAAAAEVDESKKVHEKSYQFILFHGQFLVLLIIKESIFFRNFEVPIRRIQFSGRHISNISLAIFMTDYCTTSEVCIKVLVRRLRGKHA